MFLIYVFSLLIPNRAGLLNGYSVISTDGLPWLSRPSIPTRVPIEREFRARSWGIETGDGGGFACLGGYATEIGTR